jgi:hypothetical protein
VANMRTIKAILAAGTVALALSATAPVQAAVVGITSLSGNDSIDWAQLGPEFTALSSPQSVVSGGSLGAVVSSDGGTFELINQSSGWAGNFTPGMALLWTQGFGPDITLTFASPVFAAGAFIQADFYGAFTAQVFDGTTIFTESGVSTSPGDGSAIFIGLQSTVANISSIQFTLTSAAYNPYDFAIGTVELSTAATPLPSTWLMLLSGFAGLGFFAYRGTKKNFAALAAA